MNKNTITTALIYIITILTIILMLYFQKDLTKVAWIVGTGATIVGILTIFKKNNYGYLIFSTGISLFLAVLLYSMDILSKSNSITFMICLSICLLMIITFIISKTNKKKISAMYDLTIEAKVSDLVKNPNTKKEYYQALYDYIVNDTSYTVGSPNFICKNIPNIGDTLNIRVSSKDPTEVYFDKRPIDELYEKALTIGLIIVTAIIIVTLFI